LITDKLIKINKNFYNDKIKSISRENL